LDEAVEDSCLGWDAECSVDVPTISAFTLEVGAAGLLKCTVSAKEERCFWKMANFSPPTLSTDLSAFTTSFWDSGSFEGTYMNLFVFISVIGKRCMIYLWEVK
jgi:hypothetical protein